MTSSLFKPDSPAVRIPLLARLKWFLLSLPIRALGAVSGRFKYLASACQSTRVYIDRCITSLRLLQLDPAKREILLAVAKDRQSTSRLSYQDWLDILAQVSTVSPVQSDMDMAVSSLESLRKERSLNLPGIETEKN